MPEYDRTANVPTGVANTVIKPAPGRLRQVLVTTAGTGVGQVLGYDNATTNSGPILMSIPATVSIGQQYSINMPAGLGITIANVANGPTLTVSFD